SHVHRDRLTKLATREDEVREKLHQALSLYFTDNTSEELTDTTIWEAHKSELRGHVIRIATRKKREARHN
ncbi:Hypothetical predicted protein, partial [Pelobates cultripes]